MKDIIKPVSVALLFVFLAAMDYLRISDPELRAAALAMIGVITGWHGLGNLPFGFTKPGVPAAPLPAPPGPQQ